MQNCTVSTILQLFTNRNVKAKLLVLLSVYEKNAKNGANNCLRIFYACKIYISQYKITAKRIVPFHIF